MDIHHKKLKFQFNIFRYNIPKNGFIYFFGKFKEAGISPWLKRDKNPDRPVINLGDMNS